MKTRAAHPNAKLNANCSLELQTMNYAKGPLFAQTRIEFSFRALVDRTIREQNREDRRLAEQRPTKHQFRARNSCILDGRNYRFARRLLLFPRAQFLLETRRSFSTNSAARQISQKKLHDPLGRSCSSCL